MPSNVVGFNAFRRFTPYSIQMVCQKPVCLRIADTDADIPSVIMTQTAHEKSRKPHRCRLRYDFRLFVGLRFARLSVAIPSPTCR